MTQRVHTIVIVLVTALVWGWWDIHVWRQGQSDALFSNVLRDLFLSHPMFTFCAGAIIGHIFWPIR